MSLNKAAPPPLELKFLSGEAAAAVTASCLLSVYAKKENYVYPDMLDKEYLATKIRDGGIQVFAAVGGSGTPAATLSCKKAQGERAVEITALAVHPEYRGFNLGERMTRHLLSECEKAGASRFYALMVMFHTQSAALYEKLGFVPTGFLFGVCDAKKHLTQLEFATQKHSWCLYVKNNAAADAGAVYVPKCLKALVSEIYASAGASVNIAADACAPAAPGRYSYARDEHHRTLYITVAASGTDLREWLETLEQEHTLQTAVAYLNISDPGAPHGYETLKAAGYRFAGLKPLCGEHEYMILSKTGRVLIDRAEFQITESVRRLLERISDQE